MEYSITLQHKQWVLTPGQQGWNDQHSLCRIGMEYHHNHNHNHNNNNNNNDDDENDNKNNNNNNDNDYNYNNDDKNDNNGNDSDKNSSDSMHVWSISYRISMTSSLLYQLYQAILF